MLRITHHNSLARFPLRRSYGWFWTLPDRLLIRQKDVFWQENFIFINWTVYYHIKAEILKTWKCCKIIYKDALWLVGKKYRMTFHDEPITIKEQQKSHTTKIDVLKMIPFSFFIVVPFAEFTLPLFLYLFPNMIPSSFISKTKEEKAIVHLLDSRHVYADYLHAYMLKQVRDSSGDLAKFNHILRNNPQNLRKEDLIVFHDHFPQFFQFTKMDNETLINVCRLTTMEPWTGFKVFGRLIFDPYYKLESLIMKKPWPKPWAPKNMVTDFISKYLLIYQLKRYLAKVREDDYLLLVEDLDEIEQENIIKCCRERAIETENTTYQKIKEDLKEWVKFSTHPLSKGRVTNEFMVLTQIFPYLQDVVYVDDIRGEIKPSDQRTKELMKKISMRKLYDFNERMVYRILDKVHLATQYYFPDDVRADYIEKLKQTLDEKHMPEDEVEIKEVIKLLESVAPSNAIQQGPFMPK